MFIVRIRKLILMDYLARGSVGHNQAYSLAVANEAALGGMNVEIWCPVNCSIKSRYAKKIFSEMKPFGRLRLIKQIWERAIEFRSILSRPEFTQDDLILFHTVFHPFFVSLSLALFGIKLRSKVVVIMRRGLKDKYRTALPAIIQETASWLMTIPFVFWLNRVVGIGLATDSDLIRDELSKAGLKGVFTLPIPHTRIPVRSDEKGKPVIGYLGGGRVEKGFDFLPDVAALALKSNNQTKFIFQTYIEANYFDSPDMKEAKEKLLELAHQHPKSFKLTEASLSYPAYERLMRQCSIILLPYRAELYGKGTSGILAEAVAMGKWVVVPANTWMSAQKQKYDKIVVFDSEKPESIARAILECEALDGKIDKKRVTEQIKGWHAFHNPESYISILRCKVENDDSTQYPS